MQADPIDIGYRPHRFQQQVHETATRFTVVVAHRRFGKTVAAVATLVHAALSDQTGTGRYGYLAPFLKQAKAVAWDYLKAFATRVPDVKVSEVELSVELPNGSRVRLFGGDNPDALRGQYLSGVVIDEVADLRPDVWSAILRPALADRRGWTLFIGTPRGINLFSELYHHAASGEDPEWSAHRFPVSETGLIDARELASARSSMSDAEYRSEWGCDFTASADDVLISMDAVTEAAGRVIQEHELYGLARLVGVDVARFGGDRSVIQKRWGLFAYPPIVFRGLDNMALADRLMGVMAEWEPDGVFVDAGRGEGVIDRVRQVGFHVTEIAFGGRPMDHRYADKRTEMWFGIDAWLKAGGVLPRDMALHSDLSVPRYAFDGSGRIKLESKDSMRERGMKSPDLADALALTFALPVSPPGLRRPTSMTRKQERRVFDPHARVNQEDY